MSASRRSTSARRFACGAPAARLSASRSQLAELVGATSPTSVWNPDPGGSLSGASAVKSSPPTMNPLDPQPERTRQPAFILEAIAVGNRFHFRGRNPWLHNLLNVGLALAI